MTAESGARLTVRPRSDRGDYHLLTSNAIDTRVSETENCPSPLHSLSATDQCKQLRAEEQILCCHRTLCFPFTLASIEGMEDGAGGREELCGKHKMSEKCEGDRIRPYQMGIWRINGKHILNGRISVWGVSRECIQHRCAKANNKGECNL